MQRWSLAALFILSGSCVAATPAQSTLLATLSKQLHDARSQPLGSPLKMRCPKTLQPLIGMSDSALRSALGDPDWDFVLPKVVPPLPTRVHLRWLYFYRAEDITDPGVISLGHFPPGLEFLFDADLRVAHAACSLET